MHMRARTMTPVRVDQTVTRIVEAYLEMPELRLNLWQAQQLWELDEVRCEAVLAALVDARFLSVSGDGTFGRPHPPCGSSD